MSNLFDLFEEYRRNNFNRQNYSPNYQPLPTSLENRNEMLRLDNINRSKFPTVGLTDQLRNYAQGTPQLLSPPSTSGTFLEETGQRPGFKSSPLQRDSLNFLDKVFTLTDDKLKNHFNSPKFSTFVDSLGNTNIKKDLKKLVTEKNYEGAKQYINNSNLYKDNITQGGQGVKQATDINFIQKLANLAGVDMKLATKNWKDKGGFEGLLANPGFTLGLALMQSAANGKTINQSILDDFITSGKLSAEYADRIKARKEADMVEPFQATQADIDEVKRFLPRLEIDAPNIFEKFMGFVKGDKPQIQYDIAVEKIANGYAKKVAAAKGKGITIDYEFKLKIIKDLIRSGEIKVQKSLSGITSGTLKTNETTSLNRADGGPVEAGKAYIVGERGPEIIIPTSDGNVLTNDDSQIYAMLLSANPQLQKVSKQRAEKIMRTRFPEYFEE